MRLNQLKDRPGSSKIRKRIGRGIGSGMHKTGGRGGKGQTARSGVAINGFEGGQMPLHMRLPKRGFKSLSTAKFNAVPLNRIERFITEGKLDSKGFIDAAALVKAGVIRRAHDGVRLIGNAFSAQKVTFRVAHATKGATAAIEAAGGKVDILATKKAADAEKTSA
jgi:large subunit ribosomal protein L15